MKPFFIAVASVLVLGGAIVVYQQTTSSPDLNTEATSTVQNTSSTPPAPVTSTTTTSTPPVVTTGIVKGTVSIGPLCPVEPCAPNTEAYTSREVIVYRADGVTVVARKHLLANGTYSFSLQSGNYMINVLPQGIRTEPSKPFIVRAQQTTIVDFQIDTGIR